MAPSNQQKSTKRYTLSKKTCPTPFDVEMKPSGISFTNKKGKDETTTTIDKTVAIVFLVVFALVFYVAFDHLPEIIEIVKAITVSAKHV